MPSHRARPSGGDAAGIERAEHRRRRKSSRPSAQRAVPQRSTAPASAWHWWLRAAALAGFALLINFSSDSLFTQDALTNLDRDAFLRDRAPPELSPSQLAELRARAGRSAPAAAPASAGAAAADRERTAAARALEEGRRDDRSRGATDAGASGAAAVERPPEPDLSAFERQLEGYADPQVGRSVRQFGYDVFLREPALDVDAPVGADYVLGSGDEIVVSLWGSQDRDFQVRIERDGQARLPMIGPVALKGVTLGRGEEILRQRFDRFYQNYELRARVARIRDIYVHVTGRVARPGRVRISSVGTLLDAIGAAGGIAKDGTLRALVLKRTGQDDRAIDLYGYLLEGDAASDVHLQADDVIHVPAVGARVAVVGRVLRPAIYEHAAGAVTLGDALAMAGGFERLADRTSLQVESSSSKGLVIRNHGAEALEDPGVTLGDGDVVVVRSAAPRLENVIYLQGNVSLPGRYAFRDGMRVSDIVTPASLVAAGFWQERTPPEYSGEPKPPARPGEFGPPDPAFARAPDPSFARAPAPASAPARPAAVVPAVAPAGAPVIAETDVDPADFTPAQKLLLARREAEERRLLAGRELPEPFLEYALIRRIHPHTLQESRLTFHLGKAIVDKDPREDKALYPQDTIVIFPRKDFEVRATVFVDGAVHNPGIFEFFPGMRISDLIRMSGGLRPEALIDGTTLTRIRPDQTGTTFEHVVVNLHEVFGGVESADVELRENDSLTIKVVPDYKKAYRITIEGEVRHPGPYTVIPGERLSDVLLRAGGFTDHAYLPATQFYRESVRRLQQERLDEALQRLETDAKVSSQRYAAEASALDQEKEEALAEHARIENLVTSLRKVRPKGRMVVHLDKPAALRGTPDDVELQDGDSIVVPRKPDEVNVVGAVFNQTALLYKQGTRALDYLNQCGGAMDTADIDIAFIIRADGTAESAQSYRPEYQWDAESYRYSKGGNLFSTPLYPGDTLIVPYDVQPQLSRLGLTKTITQIIFQVATSVGVVVALTI